MFKRLLAFALAGCLVFQSAPITSYAAETGTVVAESAGEKTGETATTDVVSGETKTEGETASESETKTEVETVSEPEETEWETVSEPVEAEEETLSEAETEEIETEEETVTDVIPEVEAATEVETISSEEAEVNAAEYVETTSETEEVTELIYGEKNAITLMPRGDNSVAPRWFSFTAPETAAYNLCTDGATGDGWVYMMLCNSMDSTSVLRQSNFMSNPASLHTEVLQQGETIYLYMYTDGLAESVFDLEIQKLPVYSMEKQEDGSYIVQTGDYTLSVLPEAGYGHLRVDASMVPQSGKTLDSNYSLECYYVAGSSNEFVYSIFLCANIQGNIEGSMSTPVDSASTYKMYFVLKNASGEILGVLDQDISLKTKDTDETVIVYDTIVGDDSVTFDMEFLSSGCCYYAPVDGSVDEKSQGLWDGWYSQEITGLKPATEYYFRFMDSRGQNVYETTVTTLGSEESFGAEFEVTSSLNEESKKIEVSLNAEVSDYVGDVTRGWIYYTYENSFGEIVENNSFFDLEDGVDNAGNPFTVECDLSYASWFMADTTYDFDVWIELGTLATEKVTLSVTTPAAAFDEEDVSLNVDSDDKSNINVTVQVAGLADEESAEVSIYYRNHAETVGYSYLESYPIMGSSEQSSYAWYQFIAGETYDFVLFTGGIKKEVTLTLGTNPLSLTQVGTGETNAFDIVRTFKLESTDAENMADTYYLQLYNGAYSIGDTVVLDKANGYQTTVKTADSGTILNPNTEYNLQWKVSTEPNVQPIYVLYETVCTESADIQFEVTGGTPHDQGFSVTLNEDSIANFSSFPGIETEIYIKKKGNSVYHHPSYVAFSAGNCYTGTVAFLGLEAGTRYELSVRSRNGEIVEYATFEFATPEDTSVVKVDSVDVGMNRAVVDYKVTGTGYKGRHVIAYIREKDTQGDWRYADEMYHNDESGSGTLFIEKYNGEKLKQNTVYEYQIGIGDSHNERRARLEKVVTGEFRTASDGRTLSDAKTTCTYTTADLSVLLSGNKYWQECSIQFFYKAKGAEDWIAAGSATTENNNVRKNVKISDLEVGTEYEYAVVLSDANIDNPDHMTDSSKKLTGTFTTKKSDYKFSFTPVAKNTTNRQAQLSVVAKNSKVDNNLTVVLTLSDGQEQTVSLAKNKSYKNTVTFTGLLGGTEYTITRVTVSVTENDKVIQIADEECNYKFKTKDDIIPTSITLSKEAFGFNAAYIESGNEKYTTGKLTAGVLPKNAEPELVWSVDNEDVIALSEDGTVQALKTGTAVITVASKYNENIKNTCTVTVKDYVIGYVDAEGSEPVEVTNETVQFYKDASLAGLGLYEKSAEGDLTAVPGFSVTADRENVVDWTKEKGLVPIGEGETTVVFEKDGIQAEMAIKIVTAGKAFGIVDFTTSDSSYPAIKNEDGSVMLVCKENVTYAVVCEITPEQTYSPRDFAWSVSDEAIASVSEDGVVTPKKAGKVTLTVEPKVYHSALPYMQKKAQVVLDIRNVPEEGSEKVLYALANVDTKLANVEFPASWEGWSWKSPNTPLVTNGVNADNCYSFEAVYSGSEKGLLGNYPRETTVKVYIARITGVSVSETSVNHNKVLEVGGNDSITLAIEPIYQGKLSEELYAVELPNVKGLTITKNDDGTYTITAQKAANYTLKPIIKSGDKVVATGNYKFKAVAAKQVGNITLSTDTEGITIEDNKIIFESVDSKKNFNLKATVTDRYGQESKTALQWKTSDAAVAKVAAVSRNNTHEAVVTAVGEGHAVITVVAKDAAGCKTELNVEIQNHAPRVSTNKATVNIAYEYDTDIGKQLASGAGTVEILPAYGGTIESVQLLGKGGVAISDLALESYGEFKYLIKPGTTVPAKVKHECILRVTTDRNVSYDYAITVAVEEKVPTVSAKMGTKVNLFYTDGEGTINFSISGNNTLEYVEWEDLSAGENNGFSLHGYYTLESKPKNYAKIRQQSDIDVTNGKLQDTLTAKGNITIKVKGYNKLYTIKNFVLTYEYKKPAIITRSATTYVAPAVGQNSYRFDLYDKTNKCQLYFTETNADEQHNYFNEISCDSADVEYAITGGSTVEYTYNGKASAKNITLTLGSPTWREPLKAVHTIRTTNPTAYLKKTQFVFNTNAKSMATTQVYLKNVDEISFSDIVIKGANAKAQALLDEELLVITTLAESGNEIRVEQSQAALLGKTLPKGTFSYKVTPYYTNPDTGVKTALNTFTLKVKVVNAAVTARVTPKGSLNLASETDVAAKKNIVQVIPKFGNIGEGYEVSGIKLTGEYSDYFVLNEGEGGNHYITISENGIGKLKAGQKYNLAIEYTMQTATGDSFKVTSNVFNIKPSQSKPKITVTNNNQVIYAGASEYSREYYISAPKYFEIESASGSIDCNKDGKVDIVVSGTTTLTVKITDRDGVVASANGKTYDIPVTVKMTGRDGISKDASVTLKVTVKR